METYSNKWLDENKWIEVSGYSYTSPYSDPNINVTTPTTPNVYPATPDISEYKSYIPPELMVCVVCGVDDVIVFCDACKEVIREARKQWAKDFLEEIEDALS